MAGEYRSAEVLKKMPASLADPIRSGRLRIALTSEPAVGVRKDAAIAGKLADALAKAGAPPRYAKGLRNGSMVPVWVPEGPDRYWRPGELFLTS